MITWTDHNTCRPAPGTEALVATASGAFHHVTFTGAYWVPKDGRFGERIAPSAITHWVEITQPQPRSK